MTVSTEDVQALFMSSFVRSSTHRRPSETLSTGIGGLDLILGEHMIRGTSMLILEDENSQVHSTILKVFLSEGVNNRENLVAITKEEVEVETYETGSSVEKNNDDKMIIAWRYSNLSLGKPNFKFNLSRKKPFEGTVVSGEDATLERILEIVERENGLRIVMFSLFSPIWDCPGYKNSEIVSFLCKLKKFIRLNNHVCMVSVPGFLRSSINFSLYFDTVMAFDSHLFTRFCPNYNGILEFRKISEYKSPRVNSFESLKYGIKIKKEEIRVEKIDIPPEDVRPAAQPCATNEAF